jgi:hypothetical protein
VYVVYVREMHCFSVVCTYKMAIESVEVKLEVEKGGLRFKERNNNKHASFIHCGHGVMFSYDLYICNKGIFTSRFTFCVCSGSNYHVKLKSLV